MEGRDCILRNLRYFSDKGFFPRTAGSFLEIKLKDDTHKLTEVVVKSKKGRYKRKNNPAVELMRRGTACGEKNAR